jgi:hypothetical protein
VGTSRNPTQYVTVRVPWRLTARPVEPVERRADLALLRAALGLPPGTEVRWSTCR